MMGKCIVIAALLAMMWIGSLHSACAREIGSNIPWGIDYQDYVHLEPGLIRTHSGLDAETRTRIARFCKDMIVEGGLARVYFSFKSNRLYEVVYDYKRPEKAQLAAVSIALRDRFGPPLRHGKAAHPLGDTFIARPVTDDVWITAHEHVNLRFAMNRLQNGDTINSLFVTLRARRTHKKENEVIAWTPYLSDAGDDDPSRVTFAFAGALYPGFDTARMEANGVRSPFAQVQALIAPADLGVASLSGPFPQKATQNVAGALDPLARRWADWLSDAGFDMLALLHADLIAPSVSAGITRLALDAVNIRTLAPSMPTLPTSKGTVLDVKGRRFGFFAYRMEETAARSDAYELMALKNRIQTELNAFRQVGAGTVIVVFYWGNLDQACPTENQKRLAEWSVDSGASLVVGYHPTYPQPLGFYHDVPILYSLGNLLANPSDKKSDPDGLIFLVTFSKMGEIEYELVPVSGAAHSTGHTGKQFSVGHDRNGAHVRSFLKINQSCR